MPIRVRLQVSRPSNSTYNARGRDLVAVSNVMEARGCWGRYNAHATYSYNSDTTGMVTEVTITARPVILMPRWAAYSQASSAVQQEWDRMVAALQTHENQHHRVFQDKVNLFKRSLERTRGGKTTGQLTADWNTFARDLDRAQNGFDRSSQNGRRQGVRLDPPGARRR